MNSNPSLIPQPHIEGLIFDLDGTLADTMPLHLEAWTTVGRYYDVEITDQMIIDRAGTPTIQVIEQLNHLYHWNIEPIEFRLKKNEVYTDLKNAAGKIRPITEVLDLARDYKGILPMSIGTGSIRKNADAAIDDLGIEGWFQIVVTAEDVIAHKPHPDTFLKCATYMNIHPSKCLVYEDGEMGIQAALSGGMSVVNIQTKEIFHP